MESSPPTTTSSLFDQYLDLLLRGAAPSLDQFSVAHPELGTTEREKLEKLARVLGKSAASKAGPTSELPFEHLAGFRLVRELGAGGMGVVFLAVQETLAREVALKILRPESSLSPVARARFDREARAVAKLHHPSIVTVFEAGSDQGVSFLAMEYVPGEGLDERLALLRARNERMPVKEALELGRQVALALQAAHEAGVVHRDVKPSNVRITTGNEAKLLDFGLALDVDSATISSTGQFHGTLHYVSPEQVQGSDLDGRSDVWSLGVLLYECLTGMVPFRGETSHAVLRRILENEPISPKRLDPAIPREVEIVVLNALEKQRDRRYASAQALAADLGAILELRPIRAKPTGPVSRALKWSRRKPGHASAAALGALVFVGGPSSYALLQGHHARVLAKEQEQVKVQSQIAEQRRQEAEAARTRAEEQQRLAEERAEETLEVAQFQTRMLSDLSIDELGRTIIMELERDLEENLLRLGSGKDEIERARATLVETLRSSNPTNVAQRALQDALFTPALSTIEKDYAEQPLLAAMLLSPLANTLQALALFEPAERAARTALETRRAKLGATQPQTLASITVLGTILRQEEKLSEAEDLFREALSGYRHNLGEEDPDTLTAKNNLAVLLLSKNELSEAEPLLLAAIAGRRNRLGNDDPETLSSISTYAGMLTLQGRFSEAEPLCREALTGLRRQPGANHPETLTALNNLAELLKGQGRLTEAEPLCRESVALSRALFGDDHHDTLIAIGSLGGLLWSQGKLGEAEQLCRERLAGFRAKLGDGNPETLLSLNNLAQVLKDQGKLTEAEPESREAVEGLRATLGDQHSQTLIAINNLAALLRLQGKSSEAEPLAREALEGFRTTFGDGHPSTLNASSNLGAILTQLGKVSEAEALCIEAVDGTRASLGPDHPRTLTALNNLAGVLLAQGRLSEALPMLEEAQAGFRAKLGAEHPNTQDALRRLIQLHERLHALDPAAGHDQRAADLSALLRQ